MARGVQMAGRNPIAIIEPPANLPNKIIFGFIVALFSLSFASFNPFATDSELFSTIGASQSSVLLTALGYLRYAVLVGSTALLIFYAIGVFRKSNKQQLVAYMAVRNLWLFGWIILVLTSIGNSPAVKADPIPMLIQLFTLPMALLVVIYQERLRTTMRSIYYALILCLIISYLGVALLPDRSIHSIGNLYVSLNDNLGGLWRGMFPHKNVAGGFFMELLVLCFPMAMAGFNRNVAILSAIAALIFLYFAGSLSSFFAPILALVILLAARSTRLSTIILPDIFAAAYIAFPFLVALIFSQYGLSLDNRDAIWQTALSYNSGHWMFGHGLFNGFGTDAMVAHAGKRWMRLIGHAHSGTMDTFLFFGIIGLALLWFTIRSALRGYVTLLHDRRLAGTEYWSLIAAMMVFLCAVIRSMVEPDVLTPRGGWMILVITALLPSIQRWRMEQANNQRLRNENPLRMMAMQQDIPNA